MTNTQINQLIENRCQMISALKAEDFDKELKQNLIEIQIEEIEHLQEMLED